MREQQFIRFVQQICFLLKLSQPCSKTASQYFFQFKQYQGHQFDHQIMIAACIYLSTKIFQQQVRVRDILNMIYVLTRVYKVARHQREEGLGRRGSLKQQEEDGKRRREQLKQYKQRQLEEKIDQEEHQDLNKSKTEQKHKGNNLVIIDINDEQIPQQAPNNLHIQNTHPQQITTPHHQQQPHLPQFILLNKLNLPLPHLHQMLQPQYSLSDYNQYKSKIIQAEQTLLRILGFDFILAQKNKIQLKQLLLTMHYLHVPATVSETIIKVYNDVHYINVKMWLEGVVYFGYLLVRNMIENKQQQQLAKNIKQVEEQGNNNNNNNNNHQHQHQHEDHTKQQKHNKKTKQPSQKQLNQIKRIKQFMNKMSTPQKWQYALCTSIKQLQSYAEKLANFYLSIEIQ